MKFYITSGKEYSKTRIAKELRQSGIKVSSDYTVKVLLYFFSDFLWRAVINNPKDAFYDVSSMMSLYRRMGEIS